LPLCALFQGYAANTGIDSVASAGHGCLLVVNGEAGETVGADANEEVAGFGGREETGPLDAEGLLSGNL